MMNTRLYWPRACADQFSNLLFPRRPTQLRALSLCLLWIQSSRCHVLLSRIQSFLKGYEYYRRIYELHTERGRAWREAWRSCRLWCWFIIFLCRANKLKKQAWWCFHPCRALTKPSDFILVVGARISTGLNTVHASMARWFKPVYIFAMLAGRSERFF